MATKNTLKNFYVLGQTGALGEIIRCTDSGAAEFELAQMRLSPCQRITRTTRACTETEAMQFFQGQMTFVHHRDSRFNIHENTFETLKRQTRRSRETKRAY